MGTWGSSLYANDTTCDVRDIYLGFLQEQLSNLEAYEKTIDKCKEYIGSFEEPLFWFALAETQWKVGRLTPEVKAKAFHWLDEGANNVFSDDYSVNVDSWNKTLAKLRKKLDSPMRSEKKIEKVDLNPWNLNDVYAYQFHKEESKSTGLFGKYIIIQKIGEFPYYEKQKIHMQIHMIDCIFDKLPKLDDVNNYRILPMDSLRFNIPLQMHSGVVLVKNSDYPKKHLTYLGNIQGPAHKSIIPRNCIDWMSIEEQVNIFYSTWRDREYEVISEGVYRYEK